MWFAFTRAAPHGGHYDTPHECIEHCDILIVDSADCIRYTYNVHKKYTLRGTVMEKVRVTLSLSADTKENLEKFAKQNGMTKSGLVSFLINQLDKTAKGDIFK